MVAVVGAGAGAEVGVGMGAAVLARAGAALARRTCRLQAAESMTLRGLRRCDGTTRGSAEPPLATLMHSRRKGGKDSGCRGRDLPGYNNP